MVKHLSDEQLKKLTLGGHDPVKVYNSFKRAVETKGMPTLVLARTIKGYGVGESGEGKNITHQQKKLNEDEIKAFRTRFGIPISDEEVSKAPFYRPAADSAEMKYVQERRAALHGPVPKRRATVAPIAAEFGDTFEEFHKGTEGRKASTTMVFVRMLSKLLRDEQIGKFVVPIVPDEARTFGMEALFRQVGIYAHAGQLYEPVDRDTLLYYKEAEDGQILEEGINEAGSMSSFIAAGTAYATHGINMIPFFIFYSMFGFQRVGDLIWAGADMRMKGFVLGGTAGRTTLNGEGLQHEDGNSHVLAMPVPNCQPYDPAFAYELATIIEDGIKRMYRDQEDIFYYLTLMNENYEHPPMPQGSKDGILKGMYVCKPTSKPQAKLRAQLFGSGTILLQALAAQKILEEKFNVGADVWSVTSYLNLYRDGHAAERWNRLHPTEKPKVPYVAQVTKDAPGVFVAASDYLKVLPDSIDRWLPRKLQSLGTDGFGRSDSRAALRNFFEVDANFIVISTLYALMQDKQMSPEDVAKAIKDLGVDTEKSNPAIS
jgi:pyruvate dehydrogenase E1 component